MKKIASIIALSIVSSAASAAMVNVTGTLSGWKSWNAASKAPIPVFVTKAGVDLIQSNSAGASIMAGGTTSIVVQGTLDSVTGFGTLTQVGSFTGYYDVDGDNISDDSYANSGAGGSLTFSGLSWTLDITGMHQTAGSATGCDSAAPQCGFTLSGVNTNDHSNGLGQSVFDFQGINAGFQTLPKTNLTGTAYGTIAKTWAATPGLNNVVWSGNTMTASVASRVNSGAVTANAANTAQLNLLIQGGSDWRGDGDGVYYWSNGFNWSSGSAPNGDYEVNLTTWDGGYQSVIFDNTASSNEIGTLTINSTGSGSITVVQQSGELNAVTERIGFDGEAAFVQNGGEHNVGTLVIGGSEYSYSNYDDVYTRGEYTLNNGVLNVQNEELGTNASNGTFVQYGGVHTISGDLILGSGYIEEEFDGYYTYEVAHNGNATFYLENGTLNVGNIRLGNDYSNGKLVVDGGTLNLTGTQLSVRTFELGSRTGSNASFTLENGKTFWADTLTIGSNTNSGTGTFIQNGGTRYASTLTVNKGSYIQNAGSNLGGNLLIKAGGNYILNGGSLHAGLGIQNAGQFVIAAGTTVTGYGSLVQTAGLTKVDGVLNQYAVHVQGGVLLGNGNINAPVNLTGGTLSAGELIGALSINGTLTLNGGTVQIDVAGTQNGEHDVVTVNGDVNLTGGTMAFSFGEGFTAQAGDELEFLKGNVLGSLENLLINFSGIPQGLSGIVSKTATGLKLSFVEAQSVPVPAAAWMMGTALVGLAGIKRRKKAA